MDRVDQLQREARDLRDECAVLLREMESRVKLFLSLPRRARERLWRAEQAVLNAARRHAPVAGALLLLVAAGAIGGLLLGHRSRRSGWQRLLGA